MLKQNIYVVQKKCGGIVNSPILFLDKNLVHSFYEPDCDTYSWITSLSDVDDNIDIISSIGKMFFAIQRIPNGVLEKPLLFIDKEMADRYFLKICSDILGEGFSDIDKALSRVKKSSKGVVLKYYVCSLVKESEYSILNMG